jgi:RNA polymerase sporulation-specific sigma factor
MVKVPRRLSELSAAIKSFSAKYEAENGVKPSVKTIAGALKLSEEDVVHALEIGGTLSLDGAPNDEESGKSLYGMLASEDDRYENFETKEALRAAMQDFSDTEKALIKYRYVDELSQSETSKRLGVSQMFVSRMERKLLLKLKEKLQDSM